DGDVVAGVQLRTAAAIRPDLRREIFFGHDGKADRFEESRLPRKGKHLLQLQPARLLDQSFHDVLTDPAALKGLVHRQGADLRQTFGIDAESTAAYDPVLRVDRHNELSKSSRELVEAFRQHQVV